jgi:hypothetical protein
MSLNVESATAIVQFTGLGILCFNKRRRRAENLFIHAQEHTLKIGVYKPVSQEENDRIVAEGGNDGKMGFEKFSDHWHQMIVSYMFLDRSELSRTLERSRVSIEIFGEGNPEIQGYDTYESGSFSRITLSEAIAKNKKVDVNDFRWMVHTRKDKIFGKEEPKPVAKKDVATTKLFIQNALFYTTEIAAEEKGPMDFKKVALVPGSLKKEALDSPRKFGNMASHIGAAINADNVILRVSAGEEEHVHRLPRYERPYLILIKNSASAEDSGSDIPVYQGFFEPTTETFDLLTDDEIELQKGNLDDVITGRVMCNGIVTDEPETIEGFTG